MKDARRERWAGFGHVKQVIGKTGTNGASSALYRCKMCDLMPKDHFM